MPKHCHTGPPAIPVVLQSISKPLLLVLSNTKEIRLRGSLSCIAPIPVGPRVSCGLLSHPRAGSDVGVVRQDLAVGSAQADFQTQANLVGSLLAIAGQSCSLRESAWADPIHSGS